MSLVVLGSEGALVHQTCHRIGSGFDSSAWPIAVTTFIGTFRLDMGVRGGV